LRWAIVTIGVRFAESPLWLAALLLAPAGVAAQPPRLEVHYIDVGQGDATLVRCPSNDGHLLIDSGELNSKYPRSADQFRAYLDHEFPMRPRRIDVVVASHPHSDHIGSLEWLFENFTVGTYVDNGQKGDTATWSRIDKLVRKKVKKAELQYVNGKKKEFTEVDFCTGAKLEVVAPWAIKSFSDTNDRSVMVRLTFGQTTFLWVGDAHKAAEDLLLTKLSDGRAWTWTCSKWAITARRRRPARASRRGRSHFRVRHGMDPAAAAPRPLRDGEGRHHRHPVRRREDRRAVGGVPASMNQGERRR
jgi:beta-lactamase superfamily II metal-dependent hydrolase